MSLSSPSSSSSSSFRLIVEYNGTRFHGFQSQQKPNSTTNASSQHQYHQRLSKRPRYDASGQVIVDSSSSTAVTIQDCLQDAICHASGQANVASLNLRYCSRTDKGVHAKGQVVAITLLDSHFKKKNDSCLSSSSTAEEAENHKKQMESDLSLLLRHMRKSINSRLPWDISVSSITKCSDTFHPRHHVIRKQYSYLIRYHRKRPTALPQRVVVAAANSGGGGTDASMDQMEEHNDHNIVDDDDDYGGIHTLRNALQDGPCVWLCPWPLNDTRMTQICQRLQGRHDYSPFCHKEVRRQVYQQQQQQVEQPVPEPSQQERRKQQQQHHDIQFSVEITPPPPAEPQSSQQDNVVVLAKFTLQAKSFQRSQCRNMVGLIVDICRGHVPESMLDQLFASDDDPNNNDDNNHQQHVERMASYISAAPASGLCLDQVWYPEDVVV
jgi:tRNA pseudouridine(38-40) synthase